MIKYRYYLFLAGACLKRRSLGFDKQLDSIEVGKRADFILMDQNILDDDVELVYVTNGQPGVNGIKAWVGGSSTYRTSMANQMKVKRYYFEGH